MKATVSRSRRRGKKFQIVLTDADGKQRTIHIGQSGAEDMTTHGDAARKDKYIARHKSRENWTKSGIGTAGFWAKHLLWNKDTLAASKKDIEARFNIIVT